ncbi:hypothetical protein BG011_008740 [Mortierella polycephala]|uniref:Beta-lactamase-related domain-containing protein n=1 Tax=Mortierella polycephala TaxID=41804 RepID=A0A9P6PPX4_9FUNG|nr:hypothetical protein BG011_008740 [Mortierella polycephala]
MSDKQATATAPAANSAPRPSFIPRLTFFQIFIRLLPAILFALYTYSKKGAFQPPLCIAFGVNCPRNPTHLSGLLERPDYYGQVLRYYGNLFTQHEDLGGSLAVFVDGQPVIDIFAGAKDLAKMQTYNNKTLQQVYSTGKVIEGIVIAQLVDQGKLDYEKKIAEYWPEFAQNGKEDVRLVDLMTHESGVPFLDDDDKANYFSWSHLADQKSFSERLARQPHLFDGKKTRAYHAFNRGWYLNEIVRRVDPKGRTIGQIVEQDLMTAYSDLELYYAKLPKESDWEERLSPMHDYPVLRILGRLILPRAIQTNKYLGHPGTLPLHSMVRKAVYNKFGTASMASKALTPRFAPMPKYFRIKEAHTIESTSFSLKTNAHSLARIASMMANGGASTHPGEEPNLLSKDAYTKATTFHSTETCEVTGEALPLSAGGWVKTRNFYGDGPLKDVEVQGWGGAGGSLMVWIEELGIGFAYVTNAFGAPETVLGDYRAKTLLDRVVYARKQELGLLPKPAEK